MGSVSRPHLFRVEALAAAGLVGPLRAQQHAVAARHEPLEGIPLMRRRRARGTRYTPSAIDLNALCRGPGNLSKALGITLKQNRLDVTRSAIRVEDWGLPVGERVWSRRIGIRVGTDRVWRCYEVGSAAVSK